jgi:peptide/nickel transport system substrate-binding protein
MIPLTRPAAARPDTRRSRRDLLRSAAGIGVAVKMGDIRLAGAQQPAATPTAGGGAPAGGAGGSRLVVVDGAGEAVGDPVRGGSIRVVRPGVSLANFNPAAFAQDRQIPLSYLEPLVRPDPATMEPQPWLARHWEWRNDGLELVLELRDDARWHDDSPLSAADAAFAFEVYRDDVESAVSGFFALVETIDAAGDLELRIRFGERDANWLANVASLPIFPRRQYEEFWRSRQDGARTLSGFDWKTSLPIGTGPWRIREWSEERVDFERFDGYWGEEAWLDAMEVAVENGWRNRLDAWTAGDSALVWPVRAQRIESIADTPGTLHAVPAASVMFAAFNFANPNQPNGTVWADPRVREAASLAIDRERYAEEVFAGFIRWDAAGTVAQPWANDPDLTSPPYNPQRAALLLGEAGWVDYNGDGIREDVNGVPLNVVTIAREDSRPELAAVLARVARDLAKVGIAMTIEVLPGDDFDTRWIERRDYDLIAYAYDLLPGFTDFDLYGSAWDIRANPGGWNPGGYANPEADAAIDEFLDSLSFARQASALRRLQRAVNDDLFGLWFGFPHDLVLAAPEIAGFAPDISWQTARTAELWLRPADG